MEKPVVNPEEWIISLTDVKQLYNSIRKRLIKWAIFGAVATFLFIGIAKVKYKAEANFKEGVEKSSSENVLKELIGGISAGNQPQASCIMKSYQVLKPLVEKMGLQINPSFSSGWAPLKLLRRYKESWRAEKGLLVEDSDPFIFEDVQYEGEQKFSFHILFSSREQFQIFDERKKNEIRIGKIGEAISLQDPLIQFTVKKVPKEVKIGSYYRFSIQNWGAIANVLRKQLKIKSDKDNKSVLNISFTNRDRYFAAELVNELMRQYQAYLKREYHHIAKEQLAYLEGKQTQTLNQMGELIEQHAAYLGRNLGENGFIGIEQESESILIPHQEMYKKVLVIDLELSRLNQIEKEDKLIPIGEENFFSAGLYQIAEKIQDLKEQRDLIELSLCQGENSSFELRKGELQEIRNQRCALEQLLKEVDIGSQISSCDFNPALSFWAKGLANSEEREDLSEYLENYSRLLSMKEKMVQERFFYSNNAPAELEGIDLVSARNLFLEYNSKLDAAEATLRYYGQFKKEIPNPQFDLASLSSVLKDPFCQKIIAESSQIGLQLKDEKHHTAKEGERWKEEISLNRKILMDHLDQLCQVEELNASLIRKKMGGLQSVSLDCLNRQISVLHEQFSDTLKERRQALTLEKELLQKKMEGMRTSFSAILPEKWRFEKWLSLKTMMMGKMMEAMTEVVESKTISTHLYQVASKPLDIALTPTAPERPQLFLMTCLGAFGFSFLFFFSNLIRQLIRGFPVSGEKLKALRLPVLGRISPFCDGPAVEAPSGEDLELLRNVGMFSEGAKVVGLIGGKGPDYSYALGENLGRRSAKSIIIRCDFLSKFRKEDSPGILQIWKGEIWELPIRKGKGFDYMVSGGYTPFGTEIIQSPQFKQLLDLLKKNYDWVYLYSRAPLTSAESLIAMSLCDKAVVTLSEEKTEELTPFIDWGYDQSHCRVTFITEK